MSEFGTWLEAAKTGSPFAVAASWVAGLILALRRKWIVLGWTHVEQLTEKDNYYLAIIQGWADRYKEKEEYCKSVEARAEKYLAQLLTTRQQQIDQTHEAIKVVEEVSSR